MNWKIKQLQPYLEPGIEELDEEKWVAATGTVIVVEDLSIREDCPARFQYLEEIVFDLNTKEVKLHTRSSNGTRYYPKVVAAKVYIHECVTVLG